MSSEHNMSYVFNHLASGRVSELIHTQDAFLHVTHTHTHTHRSLARALKTVLRVECVYLSSGVFVFGCVLGDGRRGSFLFETPLAVVVLCCCLCGSCMF